jgi:biotin-dependent carboxylase-like uncharacterized protein
MSGPFLVAEAPSVYTTVQDMGRAGWRRFGLTSAGAMDAEALVAANALVGNAMQAAAVEFAHVGGEWTVQGGLCRLAVTGGSFTIAIDGRPIPTQTSFILQPGQRLHIGGARDAVWGYLAVAGGVMVPREFGSRATHARSMIGGFGGRFLQAGDALPLAALPSAIGPERRLANPLREPGSVIRVVLGPQDDYFTTDGIGTFLSEPFAITWQGDRMGYRLDGPPITHVGGFNIVSDGLLPGSVQVPGNGQPIVLLMDAQTTGGYPKIATVISADLGRLAQHRPRTTIRFRSVDLDDAQLLRREFTYRLQATRLRVVDL